jgi:hypothetical protein
MCFDASALQKLGVQELADFRLWSRSAAEWVAGAWQGLKLALPEDEGWDVWIDWYEDRLRGGSRGEAHELIFVSTPLRCVGQWPGGGERLDQIAFARSAFARRPIPSGPPDRQASLAMRDPRRRLRPWARGLGRAAERPSMSSKRDFPESRGPFHFG